MKSRNRQADGWQTSRQIAKHGHILLHWVFQKLKVEIEAKFLPCPCLSGPFLCLCSRCSPCLHFFLAGKGKSPLLTTIQDLVVDLRQRMLFWSS